MYYFSQILPVNKRRYRKFGVQIFFSRDDFKSFNYFDDDFKDPRVIIKNGITMVFNALWPEILKVIGDEGATVQSMGCYKWLIYGSEEKEYPEFREKNDRNVKFKKENLKKLVLKSLNNLFFKLFEASYHQTHETLKVLSLSPYYFEISNHGAEISPVDFIPILREHLEGEIYKKNEKDFDFSNFMNVSDDEGDEIATYTLGRARWYHKIRRNISEYKHLFHAIRPKRLHAFCEKNEFF